MTTQLTVVMDVIQNAALYLTGFYSPVVPPPLPTPLTELFVVIVALILPFPLIYGLFLFFLKRREHVRHGSLKSPHQSQTSPHTSRRHVSRTLTSTCIQYNFIHLTFLSSFRTTIILVAII